MAVGYIFTLHMAMGSGREIGMACGLWLRGAKEGKGIVTQQRKKRIVASLLIAIANSNSNSNSNRQQAAGVAVEPSHSLTSLRLTFS